MAVSETELPDGGYEQRYAIKLGGVRIGRFVRRPLSVAPPEGALVMVDNGTREQVGSRTSAGKYREGMVRSIPFEPTHWTVDDD
jgi:hypothetical protein